jgi:hypothetical protein
MRPVLERLLPLEELGGFGNSQSLLPFLHPETLCISFPRKTRRTVYSLLSHTGLVSSH